MRKLISLLLAVLMMLGLLGCGAKRETRIVHCDKCGAPVEVDMDSNVTEDWILFCRDCGEPVVYPVD